MELYEEVHAAQRRRERRRRREARRIERAERVKAPIREMAIIALGAFAFYLILFAIAAVSLME